MNTLTQKNYTLRDYQQELFCKVFEAWRSGNRRLLLQLPTGAGKTVLFSAIALEFTKRDFKVLVLAHREELLLQAQEKIEFVTGRSAGLIKSGYAVNPQHLIQIASVQSLIRRKKFPESQLVIIDEAHHSSASTYKKIIEHYSDAHILGVSATPARNDGQGFKYIYDALVLGRSVKELIKAGHLCKFKLFAANKIINTSNVRTTGGDFNQQQLATAIDDSLIAGDLIESWYKHAAGKKTVVFCLDIEHSKATAQAYLDEGIAAEHIDGQTPQAERKAILERFRCGETLIISNCGIISEGFDVPTIEAIQCVRPTKSLSLWLQMVGRGLRPAHNKDYCVIIDHTQNSLNHGLPDENRNWSLEPISLKPEQFTLKCPNCQHIFNALPHEKKPYRSEWDARQSNYRVFSIITCPSCLTEFTSEHSENGEPPPERQITIDRNVELEEYSQELNVEIMEMMYILKEVQEDNGYKPRWVYHKLTEYYPKIGLAELRECAKLLGYQPGWGWYRWKELQQEDVSNLGEDLGYYVEGL